MQGSMIDYSFILNLNKFTSMQWPVDTASFIDL